MEVVWKFIGRNTMLKQLISKPSPQFSTPFHPRFVSQVTPASHQEKGQVVGKDDDEHEEKRRRGLEDAIEDMESRRGVRDFGDVTKETAEKVSGKVMEGIESSKRLRRRQLLREMKESAREKAMRRTQLPH